MVSAKGRGTVRQFDRENTFRIVLALYLEDLGLQHDLIRLLMDGIDELLKTSEIKDSIDPTVDVDAAAIFDRLGDYDNPALGLVVSGGHSNLYRITSPTDLTLIGQTIDDAIGEAYDKVAVILGVGYPGGPKLDKLAQQGDPTSHDLPRSMLGKDSLDFSFSGLKTAVLYTVRGHPTGRGAAARFKRSIDDLTEKQKADVAASFQAAVTDTVRDRTRAGIGTFAAAHPKARHLVVAGGVAANAALRQALDDLAGAAGFTLTAPPPALCTDNAAMVAWAGIERLGRGLTDGLDFAPRPRWPLGEVRAEPT